MWYLIYDCGGKNLDREWYSLLLKLARNMHHSMVVVALFGKYTNDKLDNPVSCSKHPVLPLLCLISKMSIVILIVILNDENARCMANEHLWNNSPFQIKLLFIVGSNEKTIHSPFPKLEQVNHKEACQQTTHCTIIRKYLI